MRSLLPLLALLRAPAPAPAPPFELRWEAPSTCPDQAAVRAAVEQRLGRTIAAPLGDGLVIDVRAAAQPDGRWQVELAMHGSAGEARRGLSDATDCAAAVEAAALVIAIAIDPELAGAIPEAPPPAEDTPAPAASEDVATVRAARSEPAPPTDDARSKPRARTRAAIGATAALSLGELPIVGGHGRGFVALLRPRVRIEVGGTFGAAPTWLDGGAEVDMSRWGVDARACPVVGLRPWLELLPCLGAEAGQTRVRLGGVIGSRTVEHLWVALLAAPSLAFVPRRWLALRLALELRAPLRRHNYTVEGLGRVHRTAPVTGALVAGIELRFP